MAIMKAHAIDQREEANFQKKEWGGGVHKNKIKMVRVGLDS